MSRLLSLFLRNDEWLIPCPRMNGLSCSLFPVDRNLNDGTIPFLSNILNPPILAVPSTSANIKVPIRHSNCRSKLHTSSNITPHPSTLQLSHLFSSYPDKVSALYTPNLPSPPHPASYSFMQFQQEKVDSLIEMR